MTEFLTKWVGAAFLLGLAWNVRRESRFRALGLLLAALAMLAYEVGLEESLLELTAAALILLEGKRQARPRRPLALIAGIAIAGALLYFALAPWFAAPPVAS